MLKYKTVTENIKNIEIEKGTKSEINNAIKEFGNQSVLGTLKVLNPNKSSMENINSKLKELNVVYSMDNYLVVEVLVDNPSDEIIEHNRKVNNFKEKVNKINSIQEPLDNISKELTRTKKVKDINLRRFDRTLLNYPIQSIIRLATSYTDYFDGIYPQMRTNLDLDVEFQRGYVWTLEQKQKLIFSLINEIPVGNIYINVIKTPKSHTKLGSENYGKLDQVLYDGKQRISTIISFLNGEFPVVHEGISYYANELPEQIYSNILSCTIATYETNFDNINDLIDYYILINTGQTLHLESDILKALSMKSQ